MSSLKCKKCGNVVTAAESHAPCSKCDSNAWEFCAHDQAILTQRASVTQELARRHYESEPGITEIYTICAPSELEAVPTEPIKLLEVNQQTIASGIMPLGFDPAPASGIPFPSIIIEVTPEEWDKIHRKEWFLPHGWSVGPKVPRPEPKRESA